VAGVLDHHHRPEKRNSLKSYVIAGNARDIARATMTRTSRHRSLPRRRQAYCAGADLQNSGARFAMDFPRPNVDYRTLMHCSQNSTHLPTARVGGVCMAGGMGLFLQTDMAGCRPRDVLIAPNVKGQRIFRIQVMALLQIDRRRGAES